MFENVLGPEVSYLRRLGLLCAALCGSAALLGAVLLVLQPCPANLAAAVLALAIACAGAVVARRG